jgi:spore coat protein A
MLRRHTTCWFIALLGACKGAPHHAPGEPPHVVDASVDASVEDAASADGSVGHDAGADAGEERDASLPPAPDPEFTRALVVPPVLAPSSSDQTTDYYELSIEAGSAQMRDGAATPIVGFNGMFPGPTIVATRGRMVQVTQTNGWSENVSIHNHGHKVSADSDGHPMDYIAPGASKVYSYPNDQRASTYWYHDHAMDVTGEHVYRGLAGFYIIHDPAEDALGLPSGAYDVPLLLQDKQFDADNALTYIEDGLNGVLGATPVVNGVATPYYFVAARKYRLRLLNGAISREFVLRLEDAAGQALPFQIVASDGGLLEAPLEATSLPLTEAERYDIVVDFGMAPLGAKFTLVNSEPTSPVITKVMQFVVDRREADASSVPAQLSEITRLQESDSAGTQQFSFELAGESWTMNGLVFDPERVDVTSQLGKVYVWTLQNRTGTAHPFHKHLSPFNVLDINGAPPPAELAGWKDTVRVPPHASVRILFRDESFTGIYVFHCHRIDHEDHGMMLEEQVVP